MKLYVKIMRLFICMVLLFTTSTGSIVFADAPAEVSNTEKPYLTLGADLKPDERLTVLNLLGISDTELDQYNLITVTNQDEHDYLDSYLSASVIGSRALSSLVLTKKEEGYGIQVHVQNISYCTEGMYKNALSTAGITDVDVKVAGPFPITGTAALVGVMKTYEDMTGEPIPEASKDAATNELVVTGELAENIGDKDKAEDLVALIKQTVIEGELSTPEDIRKAIEDSAEQLHVEINAADTAKLTALMEKVSDLDLDMEQLKNQAKDIYDKLSNLDLKTDGFFAKISQWFGKLFERLGSLF